MNELTRTAPEKIYLQVADDDWVYNEPWPDGAAKNGDITWCDEPALSCEVAYVRSDLAGHWLPADSAPKDGSTFHTINAATGERCYTMFYSGGDFFTRTEQWSGVFTHWMYPPKAPNALHKGQSL